MDPSSLEALQEFSSILESMANHKPPGVTKSKIDAIVNWGSNNIKLEKSAVETVVEFTKKSKSTHKLGMIYVLDSLARQWKNSVVKNPSDPSKNEGTFQSGVKRVSYYLPELMTLLLSEAPVDQKDKIMNLVAIWEHGNIFDKEMVQEFKRQLENFGKAGHSTQSTSTSAGLGAHAAAASVPGMSGVDIQSALASLLPTGTAVPQVAQPAPGAIPDAAQLLASFTNQAAPAAAPPADNQLSNMLSAIASAAPAPAPTYNSYQAPPPPPQTGGMGMGADPNMPPQQMEIFSELWRLLEGTGLSSEKVIEIFFFFHKAMKVASQGAGPSRPEPRHDMGYGGYGDRERSRSPGPYDRAARRESPPDMQQGHHPVTWDDSLTDFRAGPSRRGYIKVLSRTLFVGGVAASEQHLRSLFAECGHVQSVIVNSEKRHAFVKMYTRKHAEIARSEMSTCPPRYLTKEGLPYFRQTRWGVGFGPRECMNYDTGISVIDIDVLTSADRSWLETSRFGGTGNQPIEPGMVVEEPDIEIGGGVSSKVTFAAMSKRQHSQPEPPRGGYGRHGPPPAERGWGGPPPSGPGPYKESYGGGSQYGRPHSPPPAPRGGRPTSPRGQERSSVPPAVPGFGFSLPGMR